MRLTLCSRTTEFTASPQPSVDRKQQCDQRHDDEEGPISNQQRLFRKYVQIPRYGGLIRASPCIDFHLPLASRGQIQVRRIQRLLSGSFVARRKRELDDLGAARLRQMKK